jgi:hypothetical protein
MGKVRARNPGRKIITCLLAFGNHNRLACFACSSGLSTLATMPGELQLKTMARDIFTTKSLYDKAKTALFAYVVLQYLLKANRHLWARGIRTTAHELYVWITQVRVFLLPHARVTEIERFNSNLSSFTSVFHPPG